MFCVICGRNINAIGQDNVSYVPGSPMCEDCGSADSYGWDNCAYDDDFDLRVSKMMGGRNRNYE